MQGLWTSLLKVQTWLGEIQQQPHQIDQFTTTNPEHFLRRDFAKMQEMRSINEKMGAKRNYSLLHCFSRVLPQPKVKKSPVFSLALQLSFHKTLTPPLHSG